MGLLDVLASRQAGNEEPFMVGRAGALRYADLPVRGIPGVGAGDVVALIGDFTPAGIATLLRLIDLGAIVMPLSPATRADHSYFFEAGHVGTVIEEDGTVAQRMRPEQHPLLGELRGRGHAGLILFSSGTTGRPKAILHDLAHFLERYLTPRPALRTLAFLLFDHIGGLNTLLHTLFNRGVVVCAQERTVDAVLADVREFAVEVLPATPTFLRMLLLSGQIAPGSLSGLKVITYGTEPMDQATLSRLAQALPHVDFRQTYGMSELGILRVKSRSRDSLWMKVGGEGVRTEVRGGVLHIHSRSRMLGYLNAPSPFDAEGWYDTGDLVEEDGDYLRVTGRLKQFINVGGVKVQPGEIERVALLHPGVLRARARGVDNPLIGQHIEVLCEPACGAELDRQGLREHFKSHLPAALCPHRIRIGPVPFSHRFKQEG